MKEERLQPRSQKYKQLLENFMINYMPTNYAMWKKWINFQKHTLQKLKQEEIENFNRPITSKEIKSVNKNLPTNTSPGPEASQGNSARHLKES